MSSHPRHVHLGTRLEIAERVRRAEVSASEAAARLGVDEADVLRWVESAERPLEVDEIVASPEALRLTRRARRLVALIAACDATIRLLTKRLETGERR
jgi:transposase-like protein